FKGWLQNLRSALTARRGELRQGSLRAVPHRPNLEVLEDRVVPAFLAPVSYAAGALPDAVVTADFNGDGKLDLAVANAGSNDVSLLLGNGNGTFQAAQTIFGANWLGAVAVGDFNADGKMDLALTTGYNPATPGFWGNYGYYPSTPATTDVTVLLGHGDGSFQ